MRASRSTFYNFSAIKVSWTIVTATRHYFVSCRNIPLHTWRCTCDYKLISCISYQTSGNKTLVKYRTSLQADCRCSCLFCNNSKTYSHFSELRTQYQFKECLVKR